MEIREYFSEKNVSIGKVETEDAVRLVVTDGKSFAIDLRDLFSEVKEMDSGLVE